MLIFIIGLIVWGFVVGGLARLALPGPDPMPWYATIGLGLGGSLVGGIIARILLGTAGGLIFLALLDGTVAAFDDTTLEELWKVNVGAGFTAPPMTFEVNGKQYIAITSGPSAVSKAKLMNTLELKDQRHATVMYVFAL